MPIPCEWTRSKESCPFLVNGHEDIGIVKLVDTGEVFMYVYSFFQLSVFYTRFSVLLVFSVIYVYKYVQEYRVYAFCKSCKSGAQGT